MNAPPEDLLAIANDVADRLARDDPGLAVRLGRPVERLPSLDPDRSSEMGHFFSLALGRLARLDGSQLTPDEGAFRAALIVDLQRRLAASRTRLLEFMLTPYRGGDLHIEVRAALMACPLDSARARRGYIDRIADYGRLMREILAHTRAQAANGIRLPAAAIPGVRASLTALRHALPSAVHPSPERLEDEGARASLRSDVDVLLARELLPALDGLMDYVDGDYLALASARVGWAQYPGGAAFYLSQISAMADCTMEPDRIHQLGHEALAELSERRAALRGRLAPGMDLAEFDRSMREAPGAHAGSAGDIERCFTGHLSRLKPLMRFWFNRLPAAPCAVTRADPEVEHAMSFGYYEPPTASDPVGRYRYNGSRPETVSLLGAAHLIFHELTPGHHHQLCLQNEAEAVHPLQRSLFSTATVEGWAVYASELGAEMGAMTPFDLYGHLLMQGFVAARLVVDTGLNALGWSLEQAEAFLTSHTIESPDTIRREVLRYATDIPGQALAYGLGARAILGLRTNAQAALGGVFDVRTFHDELLRRGAYPLGVLEGVVDAWVSRQTKEIV